MHINIINVSTVIDYIENNLGEKLNLEIVAQAVHYSKYHLHRTFTKAVGLTIHDYVQRRKLTEAAKLLVFSNKTIIEIALIGGYESQQAFTTIFKQMYKKSPNQYREAEEFYPLQLRYILNNQPTKINTYINWQEDIIFASHYDIPAWMDLVHLVIDGFPHLNEQEYLKQLIQYIENNEALFIKDGDIIIAAMTINSELGNIDFLGIHPQYRKNDIAKAFIQKLSNDLWQNRTITITTFREADKADLGHRQVIKNLGFTEAELLTEFGYPTQKFTLEKEGLEEADNE